MTPWLTVVMPIHNGAPLIGVALASIAAEQPKGVEVLIYNSADDGGAARRIADQYAGRIDICWQDRADLNNWTAKTNAGARDARAAHFVMLHHDDFWLPGHLAAVRQTIDQWPQAVMSVAPARFAGPDGTLLGQWGLPFAPGLVSGRAFADTLLVQNTIAVPTPVIRCDAYLACGGVDEALWYTADWDLYLKLAESGDVAVRSAVTSAFRVHGSSQTVTAARNVSEFRRQLDVVLNRHLAAAPPMARGVERRARASIDVNCALAVAASGKLGEFPRALGTLLKLGPREVLRLIAESRLIDRVRPRLRLALSRGA